MTTALQSAAEKAAATYQPFELPKALHSDRTLYCVTLEGYANPWPAKLVEDSQATLANPEEPFDYPTLKPGDQIRDYIPQFSNPRPKATGKATLRGWKILEGPFTGHTCYELREAACCTRNKKLVTGVYLWCPATHENGRLGQHGAFYGQGQKPPINDEGIPQAPPALMYRQAGKAGGICPACTKKTDDGQNTIDNHDAIDEAKRVVARYAREG